TLLYLIPKHKGDYYEYFSRFRNVKTCPVCTARALYTTGHNISNVNTDGYSRQRVDFNTTPSFPKAAKMLPGGAGQKGTGVEIGVIERIRNKFLDTQYRTENSNMGYWSTRQNALSRMESLMNEQSKDGLQATMDNFWESLQDLSNEP